MARVAANGEGCEAATSRLGSMSSTSAGTPTTRPGRRGPTEGTSRKMRGVRSTTATRRTPAPRLLLAGLADADGTTMGVARHNDLVAHEDQLLVAVEAGRVVRGGSVPVRLAGGRRHRPQRWRGGCPLCYDCVSDFSRRLAGFRGLQEARDDTAAALRLLVCLITL